MDRPKPRPRQDDPDRGASRFNPGPGVAQDPTALTTQQLVRENFWLRELLESQLTAIISRIDQGDKAVSLLQAFADRTPTTKDVQHEVMALREVTSQRFREINDRFEQLANQTEKASRDVKSAVDAAFAAAKEAVGEQNKSNAASNAKTEATFTKQIDMLTDTMKSNAKGMDDKFADIKERITIIESKTSVSDPSSAIAIAELKASVHRLSSTTDLSTGRGAGMASLWALVVGGLGLLFGLGTFVAMIMKAMR